MTVMNEDQPQPTFDRDGYPTDETLTTIEQWPATDPAGCLQYVRAAWNWPDHVTEQLKPGEHLIIQPPKNTRHLRFVTGGWSGNESLLGALEANRIITMLTWRLSTRGGVHIYEVPNWKHNHTDSAAVQHTSAATQPGEASIIP